MKKTLLMVLCLSFAGLTYAQTGNGVTHTRVPIKIVAVGNSITDGYGNSSRDKAWPGQLVKQLGRSYQMLNYGVSGRTMSYDCDAAYATTDSYKNALNAKPDILIISLGTNDADSWRWNQYGKDFERDYRTMIQAFRDAGANPSLYFCLPPPKFPLEQVQNQNITYEVIPKIRSLAAEFKARLIDYNSPLLDSRNLFPDGLHPNDAGSAIQANVAKAVFDEGQTLNLTIAVTNGSVEDERVAVIASGSTVTVTPSATDGTWSWEGPNNFKSTNRVLSLNNVTSSGVYTVRHTKTDGYMEIDKVLVAVSGEKAVDIRPSLKLDTDGGWRDDQNTATVNPGVGFRLGPFYINGVSWSWTGPDGFSSYDREIYIPAAYEGAAGTYTVTITDAQGRQNSLDYEITVAGDRVCPTLVPWVDANGWQQTDVCEVSGGGFIKFGPQPDTGEWTWTGPNGYTASGRVVAIGDFSREKAGEYIGTYTNKAGCTDEVRITVNFKCPEIIPYINYGGWKNVAEMAVTPGDKISLGPQPNNDRGWSWTGPNGFTSNQRQFDIVVTSETAGIYTATYEDAYGCVVEKDFEITLGDCPEITPYVSIDNQQTWSQDPNVTVPAGTTVIFGPQPNTNEGWSWTGPNGFTSNQRQISIAADENTAGNYIATYTNNAGCIARKKFVIDLEGGTGVDAVEAENAQMDDKAYDLQGRRVNLKNVSNGIYLHNDKKVVK